MIDFKSPYDRSNALEFLNKFLPDDFQEYEEDIKIDFKPQVIRNVRKIGESACLDNIHVFEITHESEYDPRISLSKDSFHLLANYGVRKALIFFISKNSYNYRLSLVTVDLKWESGVRVKREYSNPRRYSFFLGPDARTHTPYDFLVKKGQVKDATDLLSRFDVEVVTKEFFMNYRGLYENVRGYLERDHGFKNFASKNNIDIDSFSKKLLGQVVFCYFLQRKGWLGAKKGEPVNKGNKDFMRWLFNRCSEVGNYFNDYLEYLFYGSLNERVEGQDGFYRKRFDCQIPFLNGGLFEPLQDYNWEESFIYIPNKLFSNKDNTGILDIFDLYNFTVYEDDPIDREVSVDPEMLGKVFENLLPENLRKGQGAYYTPREIVHYMCQESLISYLATETNVEIEKIRDLVVTKHFDGKGSVDRIRRALQEIKVCDPACGSGAFLVGMLNEIVHTKHILNPNKIEYQLKKDTIENNIYGVDIDPGAVEISRLRLWLSLVVDYELEEIEPLPNLDFKITCSNSLIPLEREGQAEFGDDLDLEQKIKDIRDRYFNTSSLRIKEKMKKDYEKLLNKRSLFISKGQSQLLTYHPFNHSNIAQFFDSDFMFGVKSFDIVIANPPYVSINELSRQKNALINYLKSDSASLGNFLGINLHSIPGNPKKYPPKPNLYAFFFVLANKLIKNNGFIVFIVPKGVLTAKDLDTLRYFFLNENKISQLLLFKERVFSNRETTAGEVATSSLIIVLKKSKSAKEDSIKVANISLDEIDRINFSSIDSHVLQENIVNWNFLTLDATSLKVMKKYNSHQGAEVYYEHANPNKSSKYNFYFDVGYILSKDLIIQEVSSKERDKFYNLFDFQGLKNYVLRPSYFYPKDRRGIELTKNSQGYIVLEQKYKIIWSVKNPQNFCFSDDDIIFHMGKAAIIASDDQKEMLYLFSLLNSNLSWYIFSLFLKTEGEKDFLVPISAIKIYFKIPKINKINEVLKEKLINIVEKLLMLDKNNSVDSTIKQAKFNEYECQINQLVYKIYGLNESEIELVETFSKR